MTACCKMPGNVTGHTFAIVCYQDTRCTLRVVQDFRVGSSQWWCAFITNANDIYCRIVSQQ